jgi:hypothetical protein
MVFFSLPENREILANKLLEIAGQLKIVLIVVLRENRAGCGHRCFRIRPKDFCDYIDPSDIL